MTANVPDSTPLKTRGRAAGLRQRGALLRQNCGFSRCSGGGTRRPEGIKLVPFDYGHAIEDQ